MDVKRDYIQHLRTVYPQLNDHNLENLISDNLLSPFTVKLSAKNLADIKNAIQACSDLRENANYQKTLKSDLLGRGYKPHPHHSIMMSYDFHIDESGELKLIEVNTNASFLILGSHFYKVRGLPTAGHENPLADLKKSIIEELGSKSENVDASIAIVDENPEGQKLYIEFLVANELFKSWKWSSEIKDSRGFNPKDYDFVYNRDTDFYLTSPEHEALRSAAQKGHPVISPHPVEYFYLADKDRLRDWSSEEFRKQVPDFDWSRIDKFLLRSTILTEKNRDSLWSEKKKWFVKPAHAFGSKSSFRMGTMSRKTFDEMKNNETIVQEFCPAPELTFKHENQELKFKYDLRCYAYRDRLQMVLARTYQGQVTNLRTALGGFTCVEFSQ